MEEKIKNIMASVFKCDVSEINEDTSPDTLEQWDSLRHMNLVVALEEEFQISLTEDEMVEMLNYKLVYTIIKSKNAPE